MQLESLQKEQRSTSLLGAAALITLLSLCYEAWNYGSVINSILFLNLGVSDQFSNWIDSGVTILVTMSTIFGLYFKNSKAMIIPAIWIFLLAVFKTVLHSDFAWELQIIAQSGRYLLPFALILLFSNKTTSAHEVLKIGIAGTFIGHGIEAFWSNPLFVDYIMDFSETFFGLELSLIQSQYILYFFAAIDIFVGVFVLLGNNVMILSWMAIWGFLTALERILYHGGENGFIGFLLRTPHWVIPIYLMTLKNQVETSTINLRKARKLTV